MATPVFSSSFAANTPAPGSPSQAACDAEEIARLKRTITEMHGASNINRPNKRLISTATLGRGYRRTSSLFQDIATVVNEADRRAFATEDASDHELDEAETEEEMGEIQRK
ncbi:hypothetical protein C0991_003222 [Blastosporella zonata]|nr:hypothetical protein C0991_003222 [Blastosporella zonata]